MLHVPMHWATVHVKSATEEKFVHDQYGHQICSSDTYVGGFLVEKRSNDITKTKFVNYGIGLHIQKEQEGRCSLAKNQPVKANWWGDISIFIWILLFSNDSLLYLSF